MFPAFKSNQKVRIRPNQGGNLHNPQKLPENLVNQVDATQMFGYATRLILITVFLIATGFLVLYSASFGIAGMKYFRNQLVWAIIGVFGSIFVYYVGYQKLAKISHYILLVVFVLLMAAIFGPEINGAHRWIRISIPGMTLSLQPSELTKISLALFLAEYCASNYRNFPKFRSKYGIWIPCIVTGLVLAGIWLGKDLGTTILVGFMASTILFVAGLKLRYVALAFMLGISLFALIIAVDPVRAQRVIDFRNPEQNAETTGYQLSVSKIALGAGGFTGQGYMCSRMKVKYLPEAHTDFILSVVGEEFGYCGIMVVLAAYAYFCYLAYKISFNAKNKLGMFLGCGLATFIAAQALINLTVISGLAPTKGMPAPFISYGGTNLLSCMLAVGILLSIASNSIDEGYNASFYKLVDKIKSLIWRKNAKKAH